MHRPTLNRASGSDRNAPNASADQSAVLLMTERALRGPLGALRVAIEGTRRSGQALPHAFLDRALDTITDIEHAAADLIAWAHSRPVRPVSSSVGELVSSLRQTLDADTEARCHFIVEGAGTPLFLDCRLVVTALERSIRRRLASARQPGLAEVMIHVHVEDNWTTISLIDGDAEPELNVVREAASDNAEALADALLARECERLGGRVSIHETGGHRCMVVVVPSESPSSGQEVSA